VRVAEEDEVEPPLPGEFSLQLVVGMGEEDLPPVHRFDVGPLPEGPAGRILQPVAVGIVVAEDPAQGIAGSPYPARTDGEQTSPRWSTIPTPSARKRRSAPSAAPRWSWESERIPTFTRSPPALGPDGREERLTDLLLAIGGRDLPPIPVDDVENVRHLVRLRGDLGKNDVDPSAVSVLVMS